ncbi:MAG: ribonuclease Z [Desulfovermiculus sp.]|nr:ribonuclease Z [Desulfovermiculus sp.]
MSQRQLTVLGTASQVPTAQRNHVGFFLRWDREGILFDPGEGTQRQMTLAGIRAREISIICLTHFHGDHCLGLPGVIQRLSLDRIEHPVAVVYPASGHHFLHRLLQAAIFHNRITVLEYPISEAGVILARPGFDLISQPLDHKVETWGYRLQEPDARTLLPEHIPADVHGPALGRLKSQGWVDSLQGRISLENVSRLKPGQSFALVMDTRICPNAELLAHKADLVLSEATYLETEAQQADNYKHLTASQAGRMAAQAGAQNLVLAHYSQRYASLKPFAEQAGKFHPRVIVAVDGQCIDLPERKRSLQIRG